MCAYRSLAFGRPVVYLALVVLPMAATAAIAQTPKEPVKQAGPAGTAPHIPNADERERAASLDDSIDAALKAGRWNDAITQAEKLLDFWTKAKGPKHFETVSQEWFLKALRRVAPMAGEARAAFQSSRTLIEQATTLKEQGMNTQAQPLFEKVLEIRRRLLGEDHPDTASSYDKLAVNLSNQGRNAEAQSLCEKGLEIRRRLLKDDHPDTGASYNNLGMILNLQGKYSDAQLLYEKALAIARRTLTDTDPATANAYSNLASNLAAQGKYAQAQTLCEKALAIHRGALGDDHPATAMSYDELAMNLSFQGKYAAAQPLFEKALSIRRRRLAADHPFTARSYNNVAVNFVHQGKYAVAQPLFEKALEIYRRQLTDNHPNTAIAYSNLAGCLSAQGKYAEAERFYDMAFAIRRRVVGEDHPDFAASCMNKAANLNAQGKNAEAQPLFEKALDIFRRVLTEDHPNVAIAYNNLAANLDDQGKHAQAQPLHEKALDIRRRLLADDHPDIAISYNNMASNLDDQGKHAQAQPLYEKALAMRRRSLTDDHPLTATSYNNLASNLNSQGKYALAQPLYEKGLEINHRLLTDDHPQTALSYHNVAYNLNAQAKYAAAVPIFEKALEIRRRVLSDNHALTASTYGNLAYSLNALGKFSEARDRLLQAVEGLEKARLPIAFAGLDRAGPNDAVRPALAAVHARFGQPVEAWEVLEQHLGRGLLDELAARKDWRLTPQERARLRELTSEVERRDRLVETTPKSLDQAERAKRFEGLKHQRELASIALGEFQTKLAKDYGALAGKVATLAEVQAGLPADTALVAWVDIAPAGPKAADPDGEHWGVVVRSRGIPAWISMAGTGPDGLWTTDDDVLARKLRAELRRPSAKNATELQPLVKKLRAQRFEPLAKALGATGNGEPPARNLIVLPSGVMTGIPIEALLAPDDSRTVTYTPSATVYKYLLVQPRPDRHAGLLALGDPVFERADQPPEPRPLPERGLLINTVLHGSNAANHGLKPGDVLVAYNGHTLNKKDDLKAVIEGDKPIPVEVWRDGRSSSRDLAPGRLGVVFDGQPAPFAIAEQRKLQQILATARGGNEKFNPLPGTRSEVEALKPLFDSDKRPTKILLAADATEPEIDRLASSGELARFGFIHLATHGVIDEGIPQRSAVILTQTGLPDPLEQVLHQKPVFDGRLSVREIQRGWNLKAELVTLSACETALGREAGGEGYVGFTQALLMSGTRSVCLSLWKVDDKATALLMQRFYANLLGHRPGLANPMPKAAALAEAKTWLRGLTAKEVDQAWKPHSRGGIVTTTETPVGTHPFEHPHYWAAFILTGDPG